MQLLVQFVHGIRAVLRLDRHAPTNHRLIVENHPHQIAMMAHVSVDPIGTSDAQRSM